MPEKFEIPPPIGLGADLKAAGFQPRGSPAPVLGVLRCPTASEASPIHATHLVRNLIGGEFVESLSKDWIDVINPCI
ncbi:hypothetical protein OPV22_007464 [Ensete ventricosum]|uniref:Uncharacterized protein n=1 Tax=Ensete ventricosum TaxID=4639 RepID=A0AAV8RUI2_ENSVE|nr:hypothetical protein OPV22_007464 [Ensete ventricosum]